MTEYTSFLDKVPQDQEMFSSTDTVIKDKVISIRLEEALFNLLQAQNEIWKQKTVSETVRTILAYHFLPTVYEIELMNRIPEYEQYKNTIFEWSKYKDFLFEFNEYYEFILEAISRGKNSIEFLEVVKKKLETTLEELSFKLNGAFLERKQDIK